nr:halocyanin domain-containing protein [Natronomonas moolapensis]
MPALKKEQTARYDSIVYLRDGVKNLIESTTQDTIDTDGSLKNSVQTSNGASETTGNSGQQAQQTKAPEPERTKQETANTRSNAGTTATTKNTQSLVNRRSLLAVLGAGAVGLGGWRISAGTSDSPPSSADSGGGETVVSSSNDGGNDDRVENGVGNGGAEGPEARAEAFVSDNEANLYGGSLEDMTGQDEVVIETGAGENGFAFSPSGVVVSTGTNVVWEWTGEGGAHNVVSEDGSDYEFESELTDEAGYTIEQTVDEAGAVLYACIPHRAQGMYGAVAVVDDGLVITDNGGSERPEARAETFVSDNEANLYEGSLDDMTNQDEVVIETGAGENGFSFNSPGMVVSTGTTIVWEWTGEGGGHNVVSEDGSDYEFESELTDEAGYTIEQTVDEAGAVLYACIPHRAQGMYGAIAVVDE